MVEEIKVTLNHDRFIPTMAWPFKARETKRLTDQEKAQVKKLLTHVRKGHMDIESIATAFGVTARTIERLRAAKKKRKA